MVTYFKYILMKIPDWKKKLHSHFPGSISRFASVSGKLVVLDLQDHLTFIYYVLVSITKKFTYM